MVSDANSWSDEEDVSDFEFGVNDLEFENRFSFS